MKRKFASLIELMLVATILSIISIVVVSYLGIGNFVANRTSIEKITNLEAFIKQYYTLNKIYPSDFDSLLSASFHTNIDNSRTDNGFDRSSVFPEPSSIVLYNVLELVSPGNLVDIDFPSNLTPSLVDRLQRLLVPQKVLDTLAYSGIRSLRYMDKNADHNNSNGQDLTITSASYLGSTQFIGRLQDSVDPGASFNRPTGGQNGSALDDLGRGASFPIAKDSLQLDDGIDLDVILAVWKPGKEGRNNLIVGAKKNDYLLAFGIGDYNFLFNQHNKKLFKVVENVKFLDTTLTVAPRFDTGSSLQHFYNVYIVLFKVGEVLTIDGKEDVSQYVNSIENSDAHSNSYDEYVAGSIAGLRILRELEFVAVVDCFGNTKQHNFQKISN